MPPRLPPSRVVRSILRIKRSPTAVSRFPRQYATAAAAVSVNPQQAAILSRQPSTQPPSFKPATFRKTQLLRQYASLLQSTPLMLVFQHNNLKAKEWAPLRRELNLALQKVDDELAKTNPAAIPLADTTKLQVVETGIFVAALKITEFFDPSAIPADAPKHILSQAAHEAVANRRLKNELAPLLSGPIALLTMPVVSPQHLKAALTILSPSQPNFPAPTRKANPGWHDLPVQAGLQKLMLMGARVEGKVFDIDGTKWVGTIAGGLDGLRAQLVHLLQSIGGGITNTLEAAGKSIYFTVEGRRMQLEEEQSPKKDGEATEEAKAQ